ncbi:hypothetical protein FGO68_gene7558 [Halteria grandinella]|uniref:PDZ domain-containing protein n=1 Tax=Halteria grandinella TaxID=5974 RepID=A0A8J8NJ74_HALGN|nr:hypothetical protein FGO68_gene7558 [Halteria grandinella]
MHHSTSARRLLPTLFSSQIAHADTSDKAPFAEDPNAEQRPYLGCSLRSMLDKAGMMVLLVNTESPAWHAGLKVGDIIIEIDGVKINNIKDYYVAMASNKKQTRIFKVIRSGDERAYEVNFSNK